MSRQDGLASASFHPNSLDSRSQSDTFELRAADRRDFLRHGNAAKLILDIENVDGDGKVIGGERMSVIAGERYRTITLAFSLGVEKEAS